jgi:hypothetical protein
MSDRDNLGKGMTRQKMQAHLDQVWARGEERLALVAETRTARTRLLEKIIAQNLDLQLIAESVARLENALRIGFDPAHTKMPPPVMTTYIEPHEMIGHAAILIEELFLDGQKTASWDEVIANTNQVLVKLCQKHGELLLSLIGTTLEELLNQMNRTLARIEGKMGLGDEFKDRTFYDYADYILPARDEIECALQGLQIGGLEDRFRDFARRLNTFDERFRQTLLETSKKYNQARNKYDLTGRELEHYPESFWWRRLAIARNGEPIWR